MNFLKKIKFYQEYKKSIKSNKSTLESEFGIRLDWANRMYTVLNVPDVLGEPYNLRPSDVNKMSEKYMSDYLGKLSAYLNSIGLSELYDFYNPPQKVDKFSYLLIIGYKHLNSVKITKFFWYCFIPILLSLIILIICLNIF